MEILGFPAASSSLDGSAAIAIQSALGDTYSQGGSSALYGITRDAGLAQVVVGYDAAVGPPFPLTGDGAYAIGHCADPARDCNGIAVAAFTYTAVPEPGSFALMAVGILAVWFFRRSKRNLERRL